MKTLHKNDSVNSLKVRSDDKSSSSYGYEYERQVNLLHRYTDIPFFPLHSEFKTTVECI